MQHFGIKNFLVGAALMVLIAIIAYVFFTIGLIVLSIAIAITLVAALMVWVTSFFVLRKQGRSVFSHYSTTKDGKESTVIDVEFFEVKKDKAKKE